MVNESQLIAKIAEDTGFPKNTVKKVLDSFWGNIKTEVKSGNEVRFIGTGKFYKRHTAEHKGKNLQTKEEILIPARDSLGFKSAIRFE